MPEWLTKEYGPFTGTVWVVIIAGGVGLGLLMRRYMSAREGTESASVSPGLSPTNPANVGGLEPAFSGGTLYNQGEIVQEVLQAVKEQLPTPATTDPTQIQAAMKSALSAEYQAIVKEIVDLQADRNAIIADMKALESGGVTAAEKVKYAALKAQRDALTNRIYGLAGRRDFLKGHLAA